MTVDKYAQLKKFVQLLIEDAEIAVPEFFDDMNGCPTAGNVQAPYGSVPRVVTLEERTRAEAARLKERIKIEEAKVRFLKNIRVAKTFLECDDLICATLKE
jgi:hypothetical protein